MKKIKLIKDTELSITIEQNQCDFCGEDDKKVFTSSFDECQRCSSKCVMQICENCIKQLYKLIN